VTDAVAGGVGEQDPLKSYRTILEQEVSQAEEELARPAHGLLGSGLLAGLGIGVSLFVLAIVLTMGDGELSDPVVRILAANAYTVGFIIVIMGRTDLFTEYTTIAILPVLVGRASVALLARLWALVYAANLVGAAVLAWLVVVLGPELDVVEVGTLHRLARDLVGFEWWVIALSATLAGWLMGLLSWLISAARDTISQVAFIWIITVIIGLGHLHHAIVGTAEVLASILAGGAAAGGVGWGGFAHFLLWTTLGNAAGGVLFAVLIRYSLALRDGGNGEKRDRRVEPDSPAPDDRRRSGRQGSRRVRDQRGREKG
jgi:formate-nitrite transporter family protein